MGPQALPVRIFDHVGLQLAHYLSVASEGEISLDPLLQDGEAPLSQVGHLRGREGLGREVTERCASPQTKSAPQRFRSDSWPRDPE
jgi:hypothetical protein